MTFKILDSLKLEEIVIPSNFKEDTEAMGDRIKKPLYGFKVIYWYYHGFKRGYFYI